MKKLSIMLLALVLGFSLAACDSDGRENIPAESLSPVSAQEPANAPAEGENDAETLPENIDLTDSSETETTTSEGNTEQGSNILVAYFSRSGNTVWEEGVDAVTSASINVMADGEFAGNAELLAQMAQEATGGDLFLIQTADAYPSGYRDTTDQAKAEQNNDTRPELASHVDNMGQYDTIVLVYPNWWGTLPQPLVTFLEEYDFSGKMILPLCTHEGSRMGSSERAIASLCPDAVLLDGLSVRGGNAASAQSDVETWINDSGILE